jgi:uncharacterized protein with PQ loop repeat
MSRANLHLFERRRKKHGLFSFLRRERTAIDKLALVSGVISPLVTFRQAWLLWFAGAEKEGISVSMWVTWLAIAFIWLTYGIVHRDRAIIAGHILWVLADSAVLAGLFFA